MRRFIFFLILIATLFTGSCSSFGPMGIVMVVSYVHPISVAEATQISARFDGPSLDEPPRVVECDQSYSWSNGVGTYFIQWSCGSTVAPWAFELSPDVQSVVDGPVAERGLSWTLDGTRKPQQAPHPDEYAGYTWHGSFPGLSDGSRVTFNDELRFRHILGPGGEATVTLSGTHTFKG